MFSANLTKTKKHLVRIALFTAVFSVFCMGFLMVGEKGVILANEALNEKYTDNQNKLEEHAVAIEEAERGASNIDATTGNAMMSLQAAGTFMLGGPEAVGSSTGMNPEIRKAIANKYGGGVINHINDGIIAMFSNPAANTQTYVADIMRSAKIIPPAQAQGLGFASLDPILETWKMFRNVAYLFFVVMFLVIGFMIMFRQKIGGQTVVTAQQAIPSIITSLIFVTFSYAIAGFMIDLMYLVMFLIIGLFGASTSLIDKSFLELGLSLFTGEEFNGGIYETVSGAVSNLAENLSIPGAIGWIGSVTIGLIFIVAMVIGIFKLFFELLKTYVTIIASIAFAPLFLMVGAIPGKNVFKNWLQQLIGNLMAFPVTLMLLVMYNKMTEANIGQGGFMPPYLIGQGQGGAITVLVGLGIILVMPEVVKKAKEAMGVKDSVFTQFAKDAYGSLKEGKKGLGKVAQVPGKVWNAQPINVMGETTFRTDGTESKLERALIGTRANRKREQERKIDYDKFNKSYDVQEGGLYGALTNSSGALKKAKQKFGRGGGSSAP